MTSSVPTWTPRGAHEALLSLAGPHNSGYARTSTIMDSAVEKFVRKHSDTFEILAANDRVSADAGSTHAECPNAPELTPPG